MVVFDITNAESFAKAKNWVKELQRQGNPNMIMALAGNKADLAAQRAVTQRTPRCARARSRLKLDFALGLCLETAGARGHSLVRVAWVAGQGGPVHAFCKLRAEAWLWP